MTGCAMLQTLRGDRSGGDRRPRGARPQPRRRAMTAPMAARPIVERALPVRTYDIDFAGIVSNIVYVRWLEDLRLAMMDEAYPIARALAEDVAPILLETRIAYERPVTIHDALLGRMWVTEMGRVKWCLAAEFVVGGEIHARAQQSG